jgi:hypothetical protein
MRALLAAALLLAALATAAPAAGQAGAPRFEDYPVRERYTGPAHAPVLATRDARAFRTRLREAAREKPNFAGRYVVAEWGCGTECVSGAIIDAKTGRVTMIPFTLCCWGFDVPDDFEPVRFRLDSSLIVFEGARGEVEADKATHYYAFERGRLRELKTAQ